MADALAAKEEVCPDCDGEGLLCVGCGDPEARCECKGEPAFMACERCEGEGAIDVPEGPAT